MKEREKEAISFVPSVCFLSILSPWNNPYSHYYTVLLRLFQLFHCEVLPGENIAPPSLQQMCLCIEDRHFLKTLCLCVKTLHMPKSHNNHVFFLKVTTLINFCLCCQIHTVNLSAYSIYVRMSTRLSQFPLFFFYQRPQRHTLD